MLTFSRMNDKGLDKIICKPVNKISCSGFMMSLLNISLGLIQQEKDYTHSLTN